jgi:hypothetical protein
MGGAFALCNAVTEEFTISLARLMSRKIELS